MRKRVQGVGVYRKSKTAQKNHSLRTRPQLAAPPLIYSSPEISFFSIFNAKKKEVSFFGSLTQL